MANAGRVELNVVAIGEDQLSAMLAKLDAQANKTAETVKKAGNAAQTLGEQHNRAAAAVERAARQAREAGSSFDSVSTRIGGLENAVKTSIKPLDGMRSAFNLIRENIGFVGPLIGGLVTGVGALVGALFDFEKRADPTVEKLNGIADAARKSKVQFDAMATAALKAFTASEASRLNVLSIEKATAAARGDIVEVARLEREEGIERTKLQLSEGQRRLAEANDLVTQAQKAFDDTVKQEETARTELDRALDTQMRAQETRNFALAEQAKARFAAAEATLKVLEVNRKLTSTTLEQAQEAALRVIDEQEAIDVLLETQRRQAPKTPPTATPTTTTDGGDKAPKGPRSPKPKPVDAGEGSIIRMDAEALAQIEGISAQVEDASSRLAYRKAFEAEQWAAVRSEIDKSNESLLGFLGTIEQAANAALPELGAGLQELATITEDYSKRVDAIEKQRAEGTISLADAQTKASEETTMAIIGGSTAVLAGLAKELGGLREFYLVKAAGEIAAGVATQFTNPAESASHFTAAALYGVAAARAGGGGGGGGGGAARGGGGGSTNQGRPGRVQEREGTSVINISTLVADRATVRRTVGAVMARRDRSGYSRWEGT